MATDQALHGLDNLEVGPLLTQPGLAGRFGRRAWAGTWPKLLAIALVLLAWQLFYLSDHNGISVHHFLVGPVPGLQNLWDQLLHGQLVAAIGTTLQRAVVGYALSLLVGVIVGVVVARIPPLRAAVGSIITGLQTMPSIAWFPFAIILFGLTNSAILFVIVLGSAPSLGRVTIGSAKIAGQAIPPGMVMPSLIHGGPGRAGGGEELGGRRGLAFYMHRVALQGDRALVEATLKG